jgi:hypothetical protein
MNGVPNQIRSVIVGRERIARDDVDVKFEQARRFIEERWALFDDPSGVAADLAELWLAVSGTRPAHPIRTRLTLHRLNRTCGTAPAMAAVVAIVREVLGTTNG